MAAKAPERARAGGAGKAGTRSAPARPPARRTFLVAATVAREAGPADLRVYAAVTRTPAEALAAVRDVLGPDATVGLAGKLSGRMAKAMGLKPGEVRRI